MLSSAPFHSPFLKNIYNLFCRGGSDPDARVWPQVPLILADTQAGQQGGGPARALQVSARFHTLICFLAIAGLPEGHHFFNSTGTYQIY